ncbi:MAG: DUF58 domain-containing protein [Rhodothermia bacterium]|nr:DUF58 domain-containing protein [Rhodothermia bacterium]
MIPKELFRKIRQIEIRTKGLVNNVFGGEYHSAFKGQGIEFSEVRPYQVGDDIRSIDWNVSARMGETYVKIFEEEREQTVMLAVDVSGSNNFGSHGKFKREIAAEICAIVAFSAIQNSDKVGLLLFSDQIELFVPPKKGKRHVLRLIRDLFAHERESQRTSIAMAAEHLIHVLRRHSVVLLISDFIDSGFEKPLRALARRHDVVAVHLQDPRERDLPDVGLVEFTDAETGRNLIVDTGSARVREAFAQNAQGREQQLADLFRRIQLDRVEIDTAEGYIDPLIEFFRRRNRSR